MRAHDIKFKMNSGDKKGEEYGFTLAISNGQKMWQVTRLFQSAPAMAKERIDIGVLIREQNIPSSSAIENKLSTTIIDQLETIAKETTPITLTGLDGVKRDVRVDRKGFSIEPIVDETNREPEYQAVMTCWSVYT